MARISIEKNISYDDVRKIYYVTFNYGDGVMIKKTYSSKAEAQKAKNSNQSANPIVGGTPGPSKMVIHKEGSV